MLKLLYALIVPNYCGRWLKLWAFYFSQQLAHFSLYSSNTEYFHKSLRYLIQSFLE